MNRPSKYDTIHAINHLIENFNEQSNDNSVIVEIWNGEECIKSDLDMAIAPYESALHLVTHPQFLQVQHQICPAILVFLSLVHPLLVRSST